MVRPGAAWAGPRRKLVWARRGRARPRPRRALGASPAPVELTLLGHLLPERESRLPVAVARPRQPGELSDALWGALVRWVQSKWRFIGPRLLPAALAIGGMIAVLAAVDVMARHCSFELGASAVRGSR